MGSKRRIADEILPIILAGRKSKQWFVEPFCGGCNITQRVDGKVLASDINSDIIAFYKALQLGWEPPKIINEDEYKRIVKNGSPELRGYAGITHSFGGKFLSTYRRHWKGKGSYANIRYSGDAGYTASMLLKDKIKNVVFKCCSYYDLEIPKNSIVYCDPPYAESSGYTKGFQHDNFWDWCESLVEDGHTVFVSEYNAPKNFKAVWQKDLTTHLSAGCKNAIKRVTEKLFTL